MSNPSSIAALYSGKEEYTLDDKGRVTVPVRWRDKSVESEVFHLVPESKGACLRVMRPQRFAKFGDEMLEHVKGDAAKHRLFLRHFYTNSTDVSTDKQGRLMIPKEYCDRLQLQGQIRLVGCGDLFEIWNKKAHLKREADEDAAYKYYAAELGL
jgi:MraZ protein